MVRKSQKGFFAFYRGDKCFPDAPGFTGAPGFAGSASSFTIGPKPSRAASGKDAAPSADSETPRRKSRRLKLAT